MQHDFEIIPKKRVIRRPIEDLPWNVPAIDCFCNAIANDTLANLRLETDWALAVADKIDDKTGEIQYLWRFYMRISGLIRCYDKHMMQIGRQIGQEKRRHATMRL